MSNTVCPNCNTTQVEPFFTIEKAPVFSMVVLTSKKEALAVPRRDIELAFCLNCGFTFNRLFDPSIDYVSMGYEDQQGFSKTFMQYLNRISNELIETHHLKGKTILEIGCGKGDFINLLNELSGGKGFGIDPAYETGRQTNPNLTFFKEPYSLGHGDIRADLICCRHTLEHIGQTRDFLNLIRASLAADHWPVLFFEVPNFDRILDGCAFWDIYYEHCSYFNECSLAHLFQSTGFDVTDIKTDYGDQYLLIEAKPNPTPSAIKAPPGDSIRDQRSRMDTFKTRITQQLTEWQKRLEGLKRKGKKTVIWGGGSKSVGFLTHFADIGLIEVVVDINPHMENNYIPGVGCRYVQPAFLKAFRPDVVIVMNGLYEKEITETIRNMGLSPQIFIL